MCFVDLKAAYDTVNREAQYGVSEKLCNIIRALYTATKAAVTVEGKLTDWFDIVNGLRQGWLLSPILFNVKRIRVPGKYTDRKRRKRHRNATKNKSWLL
jgi:hypothetical protein